MHIAKYINALYTSIPITIALFRPMATHGTSQ